MWKAIEKANQKFAQIEQIKRFGILERDLSQEEGELTPTMKVKRQMVYDNHRDRFEALYDEEQGGGRGPAPSRRLAAANGRDRRDRAGAPRLQPRRREPLEVRGELRHRCRAVTSCTVRYPPRADTSVSERRPAEPRKLAANMHKSGHVSLRWTWPGLRMPTMHTSGHVLFEPT